MMIVRTVVRFIILKSVYVFVFGGQQGLYTTSISCDSGWLQAYNSCYYWNNDDLLTWVEARQECAVRDADLLIIRNKDEENWVNIQTERYNTDDWWIGLSYFFDEQKWDWAQYGGDPSLINWRNEPDNYDDQDCAAINQFGKFSDVDCTDKLGFICKYATTRGVYCPTGIGWFALDTACYFISDLLNNTQHLSWNDAKQTCTQIAPNKNAQLLSIVTSDEQLFLGNQLSSLDTAGILLSWWTGLNDKQTEGTFVWQNGTASNFTLINWDIAPNQNRTYKQNCGLMHQGGVISDDLCNKRAHYVCEKSAILGHLDIGCGSWLRGGHDCYWIAKGKEYNWQDARNMCKRAAADLLKVDAPDEKFWLETMNIGGIGFWTGLNDQANEGHFVWADGSTDVSLVNWRQEPNNNDGTEHCAEIHRDGTWNDLSCTSKVGYICEYVKDFDVKCPPGWMDQGSECYYFSPVNDSLVINWYEAKQKCNDLVEPYGHKAYRLAVNDKDELAWLTSALLQQPESAPGYWTGLNDLQNDNIWLYPEDFNNPPQMDLIQWGGEPNDKDGSEDCAVMYEGGVYNDLSCNATAYFICEKIAADSRVSQGSQVPQNTGSASTANTGTSTSFTVQQFLFYKFCLTILVLSALRTLS